MKPTDDESARADGGSGIGEDAGAEESERAVAFMSEAEYSTSRLDELRALYDRKIYAPLQILLNDSRGIFGLTVVVLYLAMGTVGVMAVPRVEQEGPVLLPPFVDMTYPLGTDPSGKGLFRMVVHATPFMLKLMLGGGLFSLAMSVAVGTVSGFKRGMTDRILMTITDTALNLPGLPLLLVLVAILQPTGPIIIGIVLSINSWAGGARSLRSQVLQIRNADYVEATRAMGISTSRNIQTNVLPELAPIIAIRLMGALRGMVYAAVGLYFLGILPANLLNWGVMLSMAYSEVDLSTFQDIHYLMVPLVTITLFGIGTTFLAQAFDRVFNPRLRAKHAKTLVGGDEEAEEEVDRAAKEMMIQ